MVGKIFPLLFLGCGVFILVQVVMPMASYKLWELTSYAQNTSLVSPNPSDSNVLGVSIKNEDNFPAFFSDIHRVVVPSYKEFKITIPSIKLTNVRVLVDSNDFDKNLAQLPGTAMPGERGNVFITGHSSLPQLFAPGNYKDIFTNLPSIKKGDSVFVYANGQTFEYIVEGLKVVNPTETWVINPPDNVGRYMTLMTCVPPGLNLKRLIVLTSLKTD